MALEIKKHARETPQSLARRFAKRLQQSGILLVARRKRFRSRPLSHQAKKRAALRREKLKEKYEKLKKLGKI